MELTKQGSITFIVLLSPEILTNHYFIVPQLDGYSLFAHRELVTSSCAHSYSGDK